MASLSEELRVYEEMRRMRAHRDELSLARLQLRKVQAPHRWINLQGQIRSEIVQVNLQAGRNVFRDIPIDGNAFHIFREDETTLAVRFNRDLYRIECEFERCPEHNCFFELMVKSVEGNDETVWTDPHSRLSQTDAQIASYLLKTLLLCSVSY